MALFELPFWLFLTIYLGIGVVFTWGMLWSGLAQKMNFQIDGACVVIWPIALLISGFGLIGKSLEAARQQGKARIDRRLKREWEKEKARQELGL